MSEDFPKSIFFFGAGASKPAGVGTTLELVEDFTKFLKEKNESDQLELLQQIIKILDYSEIDIEQLMTTLQKLTKLNDDEIPKFFDDKTFKIKNSDYISKLQNSLKMFIQQATTVQQDKISFLEPLVSFPDPVTVFSVNYDTAIEQFCNVYKLRYTDGFEYEWNPKLFQQENSQYNFHLKKIHGSIMWYKTDNGNYVKLPLPPQNEHNLIFGEKATPLILYPMQKWEFVEPLLELLLDFKNQLSDTSFVIVVGYSFRDEHIVRLLHEAARKNRKLIVFLVDPNARNLYKKYLKFQYTEIPGTKIPSLLENRVICLEYGFEQIIGKLKEVVENCSSALNKESDMKKWFIEGHESTPDELILNFAKIEFLDKANEWSSKINWSHEITLRNVNTKLLHASLCLFTIAEIQKETDSANYWLDKFLKSFLMFNAQLPDKISITSNVIRFPNFDTISGFSGSKWDFENMITFIQNQNTFRKEKYSDILTDVLTKFESWFHYLCQRESILYSDYIMKVSDFCIGPLGCEVPESLTELNSMLNVENSSIRDYDAKKGKVVELIHKIETFIFKEIFNGHTNLSGYLKEKYPTRYSQLDKSIKSL